ncbi:hypothetical protein [Robertmurraya sp. Marseille-Q9965]
MFAWLNLASLVLGLAAWILPIINLTREKKQENTNWIVLAMISISACALSLYFQIVYGNYLVRIEDWSALVDTRGALVLVGAVLLIVTLLLNLMTLILYRRNSKINLENQQ